MLRKGDGGYLNLAAMRRAAEVDWWKENTWCMMASEFQKCLRKHGGGRWVKFTCCSTLFKMVFLRVVLSLPCPVYFTIVSNMLQWFRDYELQFFSEPVLTEQLVILVLFKFPLFAFSVGSARVCLLFLREVGDFNFSVRYRIGRKFPSVGLSVCVRCYTVRWGYPSTYFCFIFLLGKFYEKMSPRLSVELCYF